MPHVSSAIPFIRPTQDRKKFFCLFKRKKKKERKNNNKKIDGKKQKCIAQAEKKFSAQKSGNLFEVGFLKEQKILKQKYCLNFCPENLSANKTRLTFPNQLVIQRKFN